MQILGKKQLLISKGKQVTDSEGQMTYCYISNLTVEMLSEPIPSVPFECTCILEYRTKLDLNIEQKNELFRHWAERNKAGISRPISETDIRDLYMHGEISLTAEQIEFL